MKLKHMLIPIVVFVAFLSCKKINNNENIVGKMYVDNQKISEVSINTKASKKPEVEIIEGENSVDIISEGEELWFHFKAKAGELYKISWQDSWWEEYTAGSIYVTGFEEDKSTFYFHEERLLQMNGSPKVISIGKDGIVYLKVRGYDNETSGSFSINVEKLDTSLAIFLDCDSTLNFSVSAGEIKLYQIQVIKNATYALSIEGSEFVGAYGDEISVKVTAFRDSLNNYYFYDELAVSPAYMDDGRPNIQTFTALKSEKVYLAVMGAYWWKPRSITLSLSMAI